MNQRTFRILVCCFITSVLINIALLLHFYVMKQKDIELRESIDRQLKESSNVIDKIITEINK